MASTYAHYRYGQEVLKQLPEDVRERIKRHIELYLIGLHGPDIIFYYKPFGVNEINKQGYEMHGVKGSIVFKNMANRVLTLDASVQEAAEAYVLGFLCHFVLDKNVHPYVDYKIQNSNVRHAEIEVEFDRMLMIEDGLNPLEHKLTTHIVDSEENATVIQKFFPRIKVKEIEKSLRSMIFFNNLLVAPGSLKRALVKGVLKVTGNSLEMKGLLVNYNPNPECVDSNIEMLRLYNEAVAEATEMICTLDQGFNNKEFAFDEHYNHTFGAE